MPPGVPTGSMRPPTNGESFQNFARRVSEFIPTLTDCRHLDHLLIVGHQGVLSLLTALLLQMPAAAMWHFPIAHGAWSLLEIRDDFTTLRVLNSQAVWRPQEEFPPDH
ncbi:alpha-ribazole-5'-phosphate phosphatase [Klebsiella pneumoniae]|nr:alpha-ribazole-5'-phosphate phosphatase [Klebsiella pneumoniae]